MQKVSRLIERDTQEVHWVFDCPACGISHTFRTKRSNPDQPCWHFNGDVKSPTFSPSLIVRWGDNVCHLFLHGGVLKFQNDCTHAMAGRSMPCPDLERDWIGEADE